MYEVMSGNIADGWVSGYLIDKMNRAAKQIKSLFTRHLHLPAIHPSAELVSSLISTNFGYPLDSVKAKHNQA